MTATDFTAARSADLPTAAAAIHHVLGLISEDSRSAREPDDAAKELAAVLVEEIEKEAGKPVDEIGEDQLGTYASRLESLLNDLLGSDISSDDDEEASNFLRDLDARDKP